MTSDKQTDKLSTRSCYGGFRRAARFVSTLVYFSAGCTCACPRPIKAICSRAGLLLTIYWW